ncbi:hypothetical protein LZC95_08795 [Pendulispora brunnea]|uniref:Tetratricopeptide repeat protein n=1 Tax=Pendulispora brunnea TaxID=2905690 RepID=A0ABZ2KFU5_9BACT
MRSVVPAVLVLALAAGPAYAADPPASSSSENAAAAESLFQDARKLIAEKRYAEACPKFAASQRLSPAVGTLLNLGDCYEKLGKTASAWATYVDAASAAQRLNRADRERTARTLAAAVEAKLSRMTLRVDKAVPGLLIKRDGVAVDDAALGVAVPLDPGKHQLEATAPGKKPWTSTVDVAEKDRLDIRIPALEDEREHLPSALLDDSALEKPEEPASSDPGKTRRIIGIGLVGLGVVGVGAGTFFGLKANSSWSDSQGYCTGNLCNDERGVSLASDAKTAGNISTVAFITGAVALAAGAVLILTAPSKRASPSSSSQAAPRRSF